MSALKNLQDRLKQVEREKKEAEEHLNKLTANNAASSVTQTAGMCYSLMSRNSSIQNVIEHFSVKYLEGYALQQETAG